MDYAQQLALIDKALTLEKQKVPSDEEQTLRDQLERRKKQGNTPPEPPVCETVPKPAPPEIKTSKKINWKLALIPFAASLVLSLLFYTPVVQLLPIAAIVWGVVYWWIQTKQIAKEKEDIANSEKYRAQCAAQEAEYVRQQEAANQRYEEAKRIYETETLPNYEKSEQAWLETTEQRIEVLYTARKNAEQELQALYASSELIPEPYRNAEALEYILNRMKNTQCEITEIFAAYEDYKEREFAEQQRQEEEYRRQQEQSRQRRKELLTGAAVIAGGVLAANAASRASSNRGNERKQNNNGKMDLWGTAACPYGELESKYNPNAYRTFTINCYNCPKKVQCSH